MVRSLLLFCVCSFYLFYLGCPLPQAVEGEGEGEEGEGEGEGETCSHDPSTGYPAPDGDVMAPIGGAASLDILTWNLHNYPSAGDSPELVADVLTSLDVDLIALQEIGDEDAFWELVDRLPDHEGVLSSDTYSDGTYQKIAFLYRCGVLAPLRDSLIFVADGLNFPRPPLEVTFRYDDGEEQFDFVAISVHLKAGENAEDFDRREDAFASLQNYVASLVDGPSPDSIVILGDFNERLDDARGELNWGPFLDRSRYLVHSQVLVDAGEESYLSSGAILDHIVSTTAFSNDVGAGSVSIPRVDLAVERYRDRISDHRPVALTVR